MVQKEFLQAKPHCNPPLRIRSRSLGGLDLAFNTIDQDSKLWNLKLKRDITVSVDDRLDVIRHPLNDRAQNQILLSHLPRDRAGTADPDRDGFSLRSGQKILQGG